jgi:hypothetical protein
MSQLSEDLVRKLCELHDKYPREDPRYLGARKLSKMFGLPGDSARNYICIERKRKSLNLAAGILGVEKQNDQAA